MLAQQALLFGVTFEEGVPVGYLAFAQKRDIGERNLGSAIGTTISSMCGHKAPAILTCAYRML